MATNTGQVRKLLYDGAPEAGFDLGGCRVDLLMDFVEELLSANQRLNLTRVTEPIEIVDSLLIDSMVPGHWMPRQARVLDLGTGAGFPGIPLKIARPDLSLTLVDSKRKKINFVRYAIRQLGLENIEAVQSRAEDLAEETYRFDVVISKAVASVRQLYRLAAPLLKENGRLIAMKGQGYRTELDDENLADVLDAENVQMEIQSYRLPNLDVERTLLILK